jgi:hypothetical protein
MPDSSTDSIADKGLHYAPLQFAKLSKLSDVSGSDCG